MPFPARPAFDSVRFKTGRAMAHRHFWKDNVCCLSGAWRLCSWYTFALPDFLPLTSHARVICGENGFVHQKHLKNKRTARSPRKGIRFAQPENDLEGNLSFRFNPPTPPFNSSLFLSVIHVLQASQKHGQRAGRVVKPVRKFPGRKFFYGNRKKILLGKPLH